MNLEEVVNVYLNIRSERERIKAEYEEKDNALKDEMGVLELHMLTICNDTDATSIKTNSGTVIRSIKERYTTNDWDNFKKFVMEHQAIDLLERRIHQSNFKEFMKENEADGLPPGVNVMREFAITVRKPSK